jgi:hypothetical protein
MWTILGNPLSHIAVPLTLRDYSKPTAKQSSVHRSSPKPRTVARIRRDGLRHNELNRAKESRLRRKFLRK